MKQTQNIIDVKFVSVWEEGEVTSPAKFDLNKGIVFDIEPAADGQDYEHLAREYIKIPGVEIQIAVELFPDNEYHVLSAEDLLVARFHFPIVSKNEKENTNSWHFVQQSDEYIDFEKELVDFDDEGNSSVDMRLTFMADERRAYLCLERRNNDGNSRDLGKQINLSWEEGVRQLSDSPDALVKLKELAGEASDKQLLAEAACVLRKLADDLTDDLGDMARSINALLEKMDAKIA